MQNEKHVIPAAWLPQASVKITVVWEHDDYDTTCETVSVARDWDARGDEYVLRQMKAEPGTRIVAAFEGAQRSKLGFAVPT